MTIKQNKYIITGGYIMKNKIFKNVLLAVLLAVISITSLSACSGKAMQQNTEASLSQDAAKAIALTDAGIKESELSAISVLFDDKDRTPLFEIEFTKDGIEYDYKIHAKTGDILGSSKENTNQLTQEVSQKTQEVTQKTQEVTQESTQQTELVQNTPKQENIQQSSPKQISTTDAQTQDNTVSNQPVSNTNDIGLEKAKEIALSNVPGASPSNIIKAKRDMDDGIIEYEIEIIYDKMEYDFEIRGTDGMILSKDQESIYD